MGANVDVEQSAAVTSPDNIEKNETSQQPYEKEEHVYDTGLLPWMQVLGSWFLFFNSWYVTQIWLLKYLYTNKLIV